MATIINASTSAGLVQTADTSGNLNLQSNGSTIVAVTSTGAAVTGTLSSTGNITSSGATGGIGYGPAFSAQIGTAQTLTGSTYTKLAFNTEIFDTNSNYDATTNYRFTPTVAGYYQVTLRGAITTGTSSFYPVIYKNGVGAAYGASSISVTGVDNASLVTFLGYLNGSTDYIEAYGYVTLTINTSSGITTYFQAFLARSA